MNALKKIAVPTLYRRAGLAVTLAVIGVSNAMAQDATDAGVAAINALSARATTYIAAAFAVAVLVAGGFWGIRMMKKSFGAAK